MSDKLEKIEKIIEKKHWAKLEKYETSHDEQIRVELAEACGKSSTDECVNTLITLLHDPAESVQLAAVKSLGLIGNDHATAQLQWLLAQQSADKTELIDAIHHAIANVKNKQ